MIRNLRPAKPECSVGQNLWQRLQELLHNRPVPDIARKSRKLWFLPIDFGENGLRRLVDGKFRNLEHTAVRTVWIILVRVGFQAVECRIRVDVFGVDSD